MYEILYDDVLVFMCETIDDSENFGSELWVVESEP